MEYKESRVAGTKYTRCHTMSISNPRDSAPFVRFEEEVVVLGDSETISSPIGGFGVLYDNPDKLIPIRDPQTYSLTGQSITYAQLYAMLFSAYWAAAAERDSIVDNKN